MTAAGIGLLLAFTSFPLAASDEAKVVDDAFALLAILAVPVFAFVTVALLYSAFRFRSRGEPSEDGPPLRTHHPAIVAWLVVTTALTIAVIIHPGITGLMELRADDGSHDGNLLVQVEGVRWAWKVTYPERGVFSRKELVLPVSVRATFRITAVDVLHSFWIPAFRVKIDAVPGMVTETSATPNRTGDFEMDAGFRLQCAELCGLGHGGMSIPVRVVEPSEFDSWLARQSPVR